MLINVGASGEPETRAQETLLAAAGRFGLVLTSGATFGELARELGGLKEAGNWLQLLSDETGTPVGVSVERKWGRDTYFVTPGGWSRDRALGYVGARYEDLADEALGTIHFRDEISGDTPVEETTKWP